MPAHSYSSVRTCLNTRDDTRDVHQSQGGTCPVKAAVNSLENCTSNQYHLDNGQLPLAATKISSQVAPNLIGDYMN